MKIESFEVIIQDSETGNIYDVSNIVGKTDISLQMENSAGKCDFTINTNINKLNFSKGSTVSIKVDGKGIFFGYVFKTGFKDADSCNITCYDQTRYLKNKESYVFNASTFESRLQRIGRDFKLRLGTLESSGVTLPEKIYDNKALGDMIQGDLDTLLINSGRFFIIRDEFGFLCSRNLYSLRTSIVIGDGSLMTKGTYDEDIDSDTFNQVKLYKDNKDSGKREVYITKDSNNIARWGILQYYESVDENMNDAQIREMAEMILKLKNKVAKTLSLECLGNLNVREGTGVYLQLTEYPEVTFNQMVVVTKVTHTFDNMIHSMKLEVMFE